MYVHVYTSRHGATLQGTHTQNIRIHVYTHTMYTCTHMHTHFIYICVHMYTGDHNVDCKGTRPLMHTEVYINIYTILGHISR